MKHGRKILSAALAAAMMLGNTTALAADATAQAGFWVHPMFVEGHQAYSWNPSGQQTYYLSYNGTIYVQLRTVAEWMGKEVAWDETTKTISLSGSIAPVYREQGTSEYASLQEKVIDEENDITEYDQLMERGTTITERPDITVSIDGSAKTLKDANGKTISPIVYNGTNYLPIRAVAEILGMTVKYQPGKSGVREAVFLRSKRSDAELSAYKQYIDTLSAQYELVNVQNVSLNSISECKEQAARCKAAMEVLRDTPKPGGNLLDYYYDEMMLRVNNALTVCDAAIAKIDSGASLDEANKLLHHSYREKTVGVVDACNAPFSSVNSMRIVVDEVYK